MHKITVKLNQDCIKTAFLSFCLLQVAKLAWLKAANQLSKVIWQQNKGNSCHVQNMKQQDCRRMQQQIQRCCCARFTGSCTAACGQ